MSRIERMDLATSARIAGQQLAKNRQIAAIPVGAQGGAAADAPRIELLRERGVVQALDITCSCGCQMRVLCEYESSP